MNPIEINILLELLNLSAMLGLSPALMLAALVGFLIGKAVR
jgi:hypothetical protein